MKTNALFMGCCTAFLLLSAGCSGGATSDTAELRALYGRMDSTYDSLTMRYRSGAAELSPEQRQLFESMQRMHAQTTSAHGMMMDDGAMGGGGMMGGSGMMGGGAGGMGLGTVREWDQQMRGMHQAMAALSRQGGQQDVADLHESMARLYGEALERTPAEAAPAGPAPEPAESPVGLDVFAQNCAPCHGASGQGVAGVFPPLSSSSWVAGDADTPIRIVLHGLQGPIQVQGQSFNGVMPAFGARLTDPQLAAALSYVRSTFDNGAPAVDPESIAAVRRADAGRTATMSPDELR
ncbi:MAG: cytochrome c [Gemmatimonadota bacterium]|jgi:mono/diheme cytochrome c family protein